MTTSCWWIRWIRLCGPSNPIITRQKASASQFKIVTASQVGESAVRLRCQRISSLWPHWLAIQEKWLQSFSWESTKHGMAGKLLLKFIAQRWRAFTWWTIQSTPLICQKSKQVESMSVWTFRVFVPMTMPYCWRWTLRARQWFLRVNILRRLDWKSLVKIVEIGK